MINSPLNGERNELIMPGLKHVHRYIRTTLGRKKWPIHKCDLPDCSHYVSSELVEGKFSICHRCGTRFVLTRALLELAKPHCLRCTERKINPEVKSIADKMLDDINLDELLMQDTESSSTTFVSEELKEESEDFDAILSSMITEQRR